MRLISEIFIGLLVAAAIFTGGGLLTDWWYFTWAAVFSIWPGLILAGTCVLVTMFIGWLLAEGSLEEAKPVDETKPVKEVKSGDQLDPELIRRYGRATLNSKLAGTLNELREQHPEAERTLIS